MTQLGFADGFLGQGIGRNARLEKITALLDWSAVEDLLETALAADTGRPPYSPLTMFKALLLQQWYGLSDPGLEEALSDRLSFRRFCRLSLDVTTPDETTICRFRARLAAKGLGDLLFVEVSRQLEAAGYLVKSGTLIDATLIRSSVRPPADNPSRRTPETMVRKRGRDTWPHSRSTLDPDASWTRGGIGRRLCFGYKAHIGVDQGSGLIRSRILTTANTYESLVADDLVCGDEQAVYADKAYEKRARRDWLKAQGIKDRIMHRRNKHHDLTHWQKLRNRLIRPIRAPVENVFGTLKRQYGYRQARYRGTTKNALHLDLLIIAFNLRRAAGQP